MACAASITRIAVAIIFAVSPAAAQFLPNLQARTPEEFDAYLDVMEAASRRIELARRFLSAYPQSELRLPVYELLAEACRAAVDAPCAIRAARAGLAIAPEYIPLLTLLGSLEANTSARPVEAKAVAGRALALLERAKAPKRIDAATWLRETARLKAENLATLGVAAFKDGDAAGAMRHLEASVQAAPIAAHQYRLAVLYIEAGRANEARALLVMVSRDPALSDRAQAALSRLPKR